MQPRQTKPGTVSRQASNPAPSAEKPATKPVEFNVKLPGAKSAAVAGTFNGWDANCTPLRKDSNGGWKTTVWLTPGRYEYRFVIDGAQWYCDPGAKESVENGFGSSNSVLLV
jgi:1,4-alpha-glucan branching enzyme